MTQYDANIQENPGISFEELDTLEQMEEKLEGISEEERLEILAHCAVNTEYACEFFFPDDFFAKFTTLHRKVFDAIDNTEAKKICIAGARGFGKSTICEAVVKLAIMLREKRFIGYLSNSASSAELYTENIKLDLLSNEQVQQFGFGSITEGSEEIPEELIKQFQFSKKAWVANGHTLVLPRGAGQQVRGLKWIRYRPDLWVIDDLESDEEVMNDKQREKLRDWFFGALMKTVSRYTQDHRILYIDTVKHEDALITHIMEDPDWEHIYIPAYIDGKDGKYVTVDADFMSQAELDKEVESFRRRKQMDVFARELGCQATSREENEFIGNIRYYAEDDPEFIERKPYLESFLIVDPAKTKESKKAEYGFLVASVDLVRQSIYIRRAVGLNLTQAEYLDKTFELCDFYNVSTFGVEVTGLNEHITYPIRNYQIMHKKAYELIELKARSGQGAYAGENAKIGRAKGVIPLYQQGLVYHNVTGTARLEEQEMAFPRCKKWDVLDCAGYIPQMLEQGLRYMTPEFEDECPDDIEAEYAVLKDEPALDPKDWMTV